MSESWFHRVKPKLLRHGMPDWDDLLGGYDGDAIETWLDRRSGLGEVFTGQSPDEALAKWEATGCGTS